MRQSPELAAATAELEAAGVPYTIRYGSKHLIINWRSKDNIERNFTASKAGGSDWRSPLNTKSQIRQMLAADGYIDDNLMKDLQRQLAEQTSHIGRLNQQLEKVTRDSEAAMNLTAERIAALEHTLDNLTYTVVIRRKKPQEAGSGFTLDQKKIADTLGQPVDSKVPLAASPQLQPEQPVQEQQPVPKKKKVVPAHENPIYKALEADTWIKSSRLAENLNLSVVKVQKFLYNTKHNHPELVEYNEAFGWRRKYPGERKPGNNQTANVELAVVDGHTVIRRKEDNVVDIAKSARSKRTRK